MNVQTIGWDGAALSKTDICNNIALAVQKAVGRPTRWRLFKNRLEIRWESKIDGYDSTSGQWRCDMEQTCFAIWDSPNVYCTYGLPRSYAIPPEVWS